MSPATWPRDPHLARLLVVDTEAATLEEGRVADLARWARAGDLVVVNDAATLPASVAGRWRGEAVEVRLAAARDDGAWDAVLLGAGDWRTRTEERAPAPRLEPGARIEFSGTLAAVVEHVSPRSSRLVALRFEGAKNDVLAALYRVGRPVQYAHLRAPLDLDQVQTPYAARPWAVEMPSAGWPLTWEIMDDLRKSGAAVTWLTHAAGLSSTGDPTLDALLPFPERFEIPEETVAAVASARARGGRVIAVGTTAVRALEGSVVANGGELVAGSGVTDLHLGEGFALRVVDGLLTGIHEPTTSHYRLLRALVPRELLDRALAAAEERGFLGHEFGDAMLVLGPRRGLASGDPTRIDGLHRVLA